ncbi:MAG: hypothetical protein AAFR59_20200, partial [Bacteroidota bacterium]
IVVRGVFSVFESEPEKKPKPPKCNRCGETLKQGEPQCTATCHIYEFKFRDRGWEAKPSD